jgi:hypothetical protein
LKNKQSITDGQLSIFDMKITEKPKKVTVVAEKITKTEVLSTEILSEVTPIENEKVASPLKPTKKQQQFLNKNKFMENGNLSRIIIHSKGSITVEIKESDTFTSHYINTEGKEEFSYSKKSPVLPGDKIFYYNPSLENISLTKIQTDKLQKLLCKQRESINRVIHRKGDENILIELTDKIISITPIGWELPFESISTIDCVEDEIYMIPEKVAQKQEKEDLEEIQKKVKAGDYVQALHNKETIEGRITREYGLGNEILNIIFANETKHTAIGRKTVKKILKSA